VNFYLLDDKEFDSMCFWFLILVARKVSPTPKDQNLDIDNIEKRWFCKREHCIKELWDEYILSLRCQYNNCSGLKKND